MRTLEIDHVRAAHDRMIGMDPNRDARVITFVSRSQPRACRLVDQPRHHSMFDRCTTDDHARDRKPVTQRAGDKCLSEARRGAGVKAEARPSACRSSAQSFDAGEHRITLLFRLRHRRGERVEHVSGTLSSCGTWRKL